MSENTDFVKQYKDKLLDIESNLEKSRFQVCNNISSDLIRTSEFVEFPEGIFVGEFFESLFNNLSQFYDIFKIDDAQMDTIKKEITSLLHLLLECLPADKTDVKASLYDSFVRVRMIVTVAQIRSFREGQRKKGLTRTQPKYPTIEIQQE